MSVDRPGTLAVDIAGAQYGGGRGSSSGGTFSTQDESLPTFYPETVALAFHSQNRSISTGTTSLLFLGVRRPKRLPRLRRRRLGATALRSRQPVWQPCACKVAAARSLACRKHRDVRRATGRYRGCERPRAHVRALSRSLDFQLRYLCTWKSPEYARQVSYRWKDVLGAMARWAKRLCCTAARGLDLLEGCVDLGRGASPRLLPRSCPAPS